MPVKLLKNFSLALAMLFALLFSGCEKADKPAVKVFRITYSSGPTELVHKAALRMAEQINRESGGTLNARVFPSGQLGEDRKLIEGLRLRSVDMVFPGLAIASWYAPEYGAVEAPFIWRDYDHIERVWENGLGEELGLVLQQRAGIRTLNPWFRGPRYLSTSTRKVLRPEDLKGLKLRVPDIDIYVKSWQVFGSDVTPVPVTDLFMALKLGVVEGQENPLATIAANHLYEVQRYIMETRHLISFFLPAIGPSFERRFTAEEQKIILDAFHDTTGWHNAEVEQSEAEYIKILEAGGVEFIPLDIDPFRKLALEKLPLLFQNTWKPGLYETIFNAE